MSGNGQGDTADARRNPALEWTGRTRGGYWGNWFLLQALRFGGLWTAYAFLVPTVAYFVVAAPSNVRMSVRYLRRVLGPQSWWKWPFLVYGHFFSLGMTLLDRAAMVMGKGNISCEFDGEAALREALDEGRGVVLLGAHVGNWEAGGHRLGQCGKAVNLVLVDKEARRIREMLDQAMTGKKFNVIVQGTDLLSSVPIVAALRRGEVVAFNGDRSVEGLPSVEAPFLGGRADFPVGPYLVASIAGAPVIQSFAMREKPGRYRFFCFRQACPRERVRLEDTETLRECVKGFTTRLESILERYPFQWYNFHAFWKE